MTAATANIGAGESVLDTAIAYGYGSADAFTRAFKAFHGMTPTQARHPGAILHCQSQLKIHLKIEGSANVPYRIVAEDAFHLVGQSTHVPVIHLGANNAIAQFERSLDRDRIKTLQALSNIEPAGTLNATEYLDDDTHVLYWHAVATTQIPPKDVRLRYIPAGQWVVFRPEGKSPKRFNSSGFSSPQSDV